MLLYNFLKNIFFKWNEIFRRKFFLNKALCRIEKIDVAKQYFIMYCRFIEAPVKIGFSQILQDTVMISNLSPQHASWVGYYYGKHYKYSLKEGKYQIPPSGYEFSFEGARGRCWIMAQHRKGGISYMDSTGNITYMSTPREILADKNVIAKFSSMEACYIGILAGVSSVKQSSSTLTQKTQPRLQLVR